MLKGIYRDIIRKDTVLQSDSGWRSNRIVSSCDRLLAALLKNTNGISGISYLAIGTGDKSWDTTPPSPTPDALHLFKEVKRYPVTNAQISFIDFSEITSADPTGTLLITMTISGSSLTNGTAVQLREFGLFGGNATGNANSGNLIDYIIHPRIDITPDLTIERTVKLVFASGTLKST